MQKVADFVRRWQRAVIIGLVALSTFLVANLAWSYYALQRDRDAQARFAQVISVFDETVRSADTEGFKRVIIEAQKVRDEYGSSPVAELAQYYIAIAEESLGNTDRAVQHLQHLTRNGTPMMKHLAQFALGTLYGNHGEMQRAMKVFQELETSGAYSQHIGFSTADLPVNTPHHLPIP